MSVTGTRAQAPEPRPMRADAQRNYARLLEAASSAFVEHGADDVSLEEIARRAGVGIGTLYRHFPTRQALLEAVYTDQVESLSARAAELLSSCGKQIGGAAQSLIARAQQAGVVRPDADARDLIRLVHAVNIATEKAPDPGQADRMLALILDGLRPQPGAS
jgi:AcrR family transcriptional regulator